MAVQWGGWSGHLSVGIDVWWDAPSTASTVGMHIRYYVQSDGYGFADNQWLNVSDPAGSRRYDFYNNLKTGSLYIGGWDGQIGNWYGGGSGTTASASLGGAFNGAVPSHTRWDTAPGRAPSIPDPPGSPMFTNITSNNIRVTVNRPSDNGAGIEEWSFRRATDAGFTQNVVDVNHNGNVLDIGGLSRATTYWFAVRCRNAVGWSSFGTPYTAARTLATVPDAPGTPTASAITSTAANINWSQPGDGGAAMSTFDIEWATNSAFTAGRKVQQDGTSPTTLSGLTRNTQYWARVRGINSLGAGGWSPAVTFKTLAELPAAPVVALAGEPDVTSGAITWTPGDDGGTPITGYVVEWSDKQFATPGPTVTHPATARGQTITGLTPATAYKVAVRAVNAVGYGPWSTHATITTLSGGKVKVNGVWVNAKAFIKVDGKWVAAKVWKKKKGVWSL